jgi:hypothetical protein
MNTRADDIFEILTKAADRRLKVAEVLKQLKAIEKNNELDSASVSVTVRQDNNTRKNRGETPRFKHSGDGNERHGYVSLAAPEPLHDSRKQILEKAEEQIPLLIEAANKEVKSKLNGDIEALKWQDFESSFLTDVLETLGFTQIQITKRTRDGGKDAECEYQRGIVRSKVIVSAKHWGKSGTPVGVDEVQRVRGIKTEADTAIIITSSTFTEDAKKEAAPGQGARTVVLIDGGLIVDACFKSGLGVEVMASVPKLVRFTGLKKGEQ